MNIYLRELRANWKALLFWCLGILAMVGGGMGKYAGFAASDKAAFEILDMLPKPVLALFGMNGIDASTASGFYAIIYFLMLIMAGIHATMLGAGIISKEERDKTSEFLFVRPVSRVSVISSKILAALTIVLLFNLATLVISLGLAAEVAVNEPNLPRDIFVLMVAMLIVQIMFLFIGTSFAGIWKRPDASAGAATTFMLGTYVLSVFIDISDTFDFLKYLTPFKYFEARTLINGGSFEPVFIILSVLLIGAFIGVTYYSFPRRDLYI